MNTNKWNRIFDWGSDELLDMRQVGERAFQFVQITDMDACCGSDNDGRPKYVAELMLVDLEAIGPEQIAEAIKSSGWEGMPNTSDAYAEACRSYGIKAPLWSEDGNNWNKLLRSARREANALLDDDALTSAMDRPVNKIGSTAAEYMRGDLFSGMTRGVLAGDTGCRIMAKMHGVDQVAIDDARPADWMPYLMGYMSGVNDHERETGDDLAPEYDLGFQRGVRVRNGDAPAPGWIKQR